MTRVYVPTTLAGLAVLRDEGTLPASTERYVADGEGEEQEYAALVAAAEDSAALLAREGGPARRVVVVADLADPDGAVPLREVVAVHADEHEDTDPADDLGWYATQEIADLLGR